MLISGIYGHSMKSAVDTNRRSQREEYGRIRRPLVCAGFQHAALEFARNMLFVENASSGEYDPASSELFISRLPCSLVEREMTAAAPVFCRNPVRATNFFHPHGATYESRDERSGEPSRRVMIVSLGSSALFCYIIYRATLF